jgi:hypothetical protein
MAPSFDRTNTATGRSQSELKQRTKSTRVHEHPPGETHNLAPAAEGFDPTLSPVSSLSSISEDGDNALQDKPSSSPPKASATTTSYDFFLDCVRDFFCLKSGSG